MRAIPTLRIILGACAALPLLTGLALAQPAPGPGPGPDMGPGDHAGPPGHRPPPPHRRYHIRHHHRVYY